MQAVFNHFLSGSTALDVQLATHAPAAAITARQQVRLGGLLYDLAQGSSRFVNYLRDYQAAGNCLQALPVSHKADLMAHFGDWVTDPALRLPELQAFTADAGRIGEPCLGRYVVWESSGSSGQPGIFVQDAHCMAIYDALESLRRSPASLLRRSLDPLYCQERVAFVGATGGHFASLVQMLRLQAIYPWTRHSLRSISMLQPMADVVAALNAFQPTIVATYPSVAVELAAQQADGALAIAPQECWTGGETLSAVARAHVCHSLHCTLRDHYGASEFLSIASECSHGNLHANTDWLILEPVDAQGRPVPAGHFSATTLLTHLGNRVQPLIRYDLGDQVRVGAAPCACGSALPVIQVAGRNDPPLKMRGAQGQSVVLLPLALTTVLEEQAGLFEFQLRQRDANTLDLRVPQGGAPGDAALRRGRKALEDFARGQGLDALHITTHKGLALQRGTSGKTARVIAA